ncbi:MFS transporter [Sphingobium sp. Z007]|uniref:MFS transporter n=1 Tax=Sphingobium sp. Z007 TaxID=627495 RepID=UPI000B499A11|nr:MFS transporter [Sphingobium sp. Z007]
MHHVDPQGAESGPSPARALSPARRGMLIAAILSGNAAAALLYDALPPILADLAKLLGGGIRGQFLAQLASTLPMLGVMLSGLFSGLLIATIGIRPVQLGALALFASFGTAGAFIDQPMLLLGSRFVMGCAIGTMITCGTTLIAAWFTGKDRARMNGWLVSAGAIAAIGFLFIAGQVASLWWRAPFLLHGLVGILFLLPILMLRPLPAAAVPPIGTQPGHIARLRRLAPVTPVYLIALALFVLMLLFNVQTTFLMSDVGITSHARIALVFMVNAAAVTLASFGFGYVANRLTPANAMRIVFLLVAGSMLIVGSAQAQWQFALGLGISGVGVGIGLTTLWTWTMQRAPRDVVPHAVGLMMTCMYLGGAASPFVLAPVRALFGLRGQYFALAALIFIVLLLLTIAGRGERPKPAT